MSFLFYFYIGLKNRLMTVLLLLTVTVPEIVRNLFTLYHLYKSNFIYADKQFLLY